MQSISSPKIIITSVFLHLFSLIGTQFLLTPTRQGLLLI
nr:MAG TPA: hypothetical protein [Caudoviricetes sp.]